MTEAEFERFYGETSRPLQAYVRRVGGDPALAEDIVHESFMRFLDADGEARRSGAAEFAAPRAYLYRIATNLMRDHGRRERRRGRALRSWLDLLTNRRAIDAERVFARAHDMEAVFDCLKPRERALLWLAHVEEADHAAIASVLDLRAGSVRVLLHRARTKLAVEICRRERGDDLSRKRTRTADTGDERLPEESFIL